MTPLLSQSAVNELAQYMEAARISCLTFSRYESRDELKIEAKVYETRKVRRPHVVE